MIERPVLIVGAPRSGTSLLFSILASSRELWSLYSESESVIGRYFHPSMVGWQRGNRLVAQDLTPGAATAIRREFERKAMNFQRWLPGLQTRIYSDRIDLATFARRSLGALTRIARPRRIRLLEKTPKNCLRVSFLDALFPDARFIFLARDGRANVASLFEGWRAGGPFRSYRLPQRLDVEDYEERDRWTFVLPPDWQELARGHSLMGVCAQQYVACNEIALDELDALAPERIYRIRYEDLVSDPESSVRDLCDFAEIPFGGAVAAMASRPPRNVNSVTPPAAEKWRRFEREISSIMPKLRPTMERLGYRLE